MMPLPVFLTSFVNTFLGLGRVKPAELDGLLSLSARSPGGALAFRVMSRRGIAMFKERADGFDGSRPVG